MANKKKNFWYVIVMTSTGPTFVTGINRSEKTAQWNKDEKPLELGEYWAKDLAFGLQCNWNIAYAVCNGYELDSQPYRYNVGSFEWKMNDKEDSEE